MNLPDKRPPSITAHERELRVEALCTLMEEAGLAAILLGSTTSLQYFTGLRWSPSERLVGALIHVDGRINYICPRFELDKIGGLLTLPGEILTWEEEVSPYHLAASRIAPGGKAGVDDQAATFVWLGMAKAMGAEHIVGAGPLIQRLRCIKSPSEIALLSYAKRITLEVQKRARDFLEVGVRTSDVIRFIDAEHRRLGEGGSSFCLVSFGDDSCLPHGGEGDRALRQDELVLIDTGTLIDGYNSDITRTYVFGEPTKTIRQVWDHEKQAQAAAFEAAIVGAACEDVDAAARDLLTRLGYGPDYALPGLPHRTGHGIGLDIHEAPNLVRGDKTPLAPGMCFSNEPMLVVPGAFGVRLEDHFHMTDNGPVWFTQPAHSLDDPFASAPAWEEERP
nr:Xaa-Pro peptidase family protein [uncultured Brevundimonas sp.]